MVKRILSLLLMCVLTLSAWSQDMQGHVLLMELKDGAVHRFVLLHKPVLTHVDSRIVQINSDVITASYAIEDIKKYRFEVQDLTAIDDVLEETERFTVVYTDGETVRIGGVSDSDAISVYSVDGRKVSADVSRDGSQAAVSLVSLPHGVYVVNVNGKQSFKVVRK